MGPNYDGWITYISVNIVASFKLIEFDKTHSLLEARAMRPRKDHEPFVSSIQIPEFIIFNIQEHPWLLLGKI